MTAALSSLEEKAQGADPHPLRAFTLGFSEEERRRLDSLAYFGKNTVHEERPQALYLSLTTREPGVVLIRSGSTVDPLQVVRILRHAERQLPVMILSESPIEASYYASHHAFGPLLSGVWAPALEEAPLRGVLSTLGRWAALRQSPPPIKGEMDERGLAKLLLTVATQRLSGVIHLVRNQNKRSLFFSEGQLVDASSNILSEIFGRFLLARGVIGDVEYRWAQKLQEREGIRQGEALVKIGVFNQQTLFKLLREQIRAKILNAFVGTPTTFEAQFGEQALVQATNRFYFPISDILVQGLFRTSTGEEIRRYWKELSGRKLLLLPLGASLWSELQPHFSNGRQKGLCEGHPISELFAKETPLRDRLALTEILRASGLAEVVSESVSDLYTSGWSYEADTTLPLVETELATEGLEEETMEELMAKVLTIRAGDYFGLLQIHRSADEKQVEAAYTKQKSDFAFERFSEHASVVAKLEELHAKLEEAREVLCDPLRRREYERKIDADGSARKVRRTTSLRSEDAYQEGLRLLEEEDFVKAKVAFDLACGLNKTEPLFTLYSGWATMAPFEPGSPEWTKGKQLISTALGMNPLMAIGYTFLAKVCIKEGDQEEAVENLKMALNLDEGMAPAQELLDELQSEA